MNQVMTVLGPVAPEELGRVMPHEHLFSLTPGAWATGGREDQAVDVAVGALQALRESGFGTVVDLSPYGVVGRSVDGANVADLADASRRSGMHIVAGTALYLESYAPAWAAAASIDELTERFVADAQEGIAGTGIRAGVFGEQATSLGVITPYEDRVLRAVARAAVETGLSVMTHTTHGTMALDQVRIVREEGLVAERLVVGHMDTQLSTDVAQSVLDTGASIAVDTIGKEVWDFFLGPQPEHRPDGEFGKRAFARSDRGRARMVADLVALGHADRILLAQDMTGAETWMNASTHGAFGYNYLGAEFLPMLREAGVSSEDIDRMTIVNPARVLTVTS